MDFLGFLKIFLVLAGALFAITQYYDTRHKNIIETLQAKVNGSELPNQNPLCLTINEKWEKIQNWQSPKINNQPIITLLLILLVLAALCFTGYAFSDWLRLIIRLDENFFLIKSFVTKVLSFSLSVLGFWVLINYVRMNNEYKTFKQMTIDFEQLYQAACKTKENI